MSDEIGQFRNVQVWIPGLVAGTTNDEFDMDCSIRSGGDWDIPDEDVSTLSSIRRVLIGFSDEIRESSDDRNDTEPTCSLVPDITSLIAAGFPVTLGLIIIGISIWKD